MLTPDAATRFAAEYRKWLDLLDAVLLGRDAVELAAIARFLAETGTARPGR